MGFYMFFFTCNLVVPYLLLNDKSYYQETKDYFAGIIINLVLNPLSLK